MEVKRYIELDYGHTLPNHYSFCNQLHGHRGRVEVTVVGDICTKSDDSSEGMVLDFKIIKELLMEKIHDVLDHGFAVWIKDVEDLAYVKKRNNKVLITQEPPTAEVLAKWAYNQLASSIRKHGLQLKSVSWRETPSSVATFYGD